MLAARMLDFEGPERQEITIAVKTIEDLADKKKLDTFTTKLLSKVQFSVTTPLLSKRRLSHRSWVSTKK